MLAIGITASSFYDVQKDVVMKPGDSESLGKYTFKYIDVSEKTLSALVGHVARSGNIDLNDTDKFENSKNRLAEVFRLITASPDFQRA